MCVIDLLAFGLLLGTEVVEEEYFKQQQKPGVGGDGPFMRREDG